MLTTQQLEEYALISKLVIDENLVITWVYRDQPEMEEDSGWRIFSGEEPEEFFDEDAEDNFVMIQLKDLVENDPTLESILKSPSNSEFERIDENSPWTIPSDDM